MLNTPKAVLLAAAAALTCQVASADTIFGLYASADYWQYDGSGTFADTDTTPRDFTLDQGKEPNFTVRLEHPVPLLPNVRLRYTSLPVTGASDGTATFKFGGQSFVGTKAVIDGDLSALDATLYYEILDNVVSADVGVNVKMLDGFVTATDTTSKQSKTIDLSYPIPMLYVSAGGSLPFTGWSAKADVSAVSFQGSSITDAQAEIQYDFIDNLAADIGLKAGYRLLNVKLNDVENIDADVKIKGPYVGLQAHF